jgi:phospholipid/cholesterol/gamma-HCH transport system substrate-binding protein
LKISKELKAGVIAIISIALLVFGINFLKGNSFFGGDDIYYAYFSNSGQLATASNVTLNGVIVGKVLDVEYVPKNPAGRKVKVTFTIQNHKVKLPVGSEVEIGSLDLFNKGMIITVGSDLSKGYLKPGSVLSGKVAVDMISQVKSYADPISQKVQAMMTSIDKMVTSVTSFWDATATSEIEKSMKEVKIAIERIGNVAKEIELLVGEERIKFAKIMNNVESITSNLKRSNEEVNSIVGNVKKITDDMVTSDFKGVIAKSSETLKTFNELLLKAKNGDGSLGKLIGDDKLYLQLVNTNNDLQELVGDIKVHPERYIHFSLFGTKTKGVPLSSTEEEKLHQLLDSSLTN